MWFPSFLLSQEMVLRISLGCPDSLVFPRDRGGSNGGWSGIMSFSVQNPGAPGLWEEL